MAVRIIRGNERVTVPRKRFEGGTNPSRAPDIRLPGPMFDNRPHRNVGNGMIMRELGELPDERLIAVMVDHGCPVWAASEIRNSGMARFNAVRFYFDVEAAAAGDYEAREIVSNARAGWADLRRAELISETPGHTVGLWDR